MGVSHSGHGVDLEVLVGANGGSLLNRSPVSERGLGIVEPLVAEMLDVVAVDVRDTGGGLGAVDAATEVEHLGADFLVQVGGALELHEVVVEVVATTDNLNIVDEVRVDGGEADTAVVHLAGENFVSVEVVSEKAGVGVGEVVGLSHGHIDEVTEQSVHRVVLLLHIIEVLSVFVNSV